MWEGHGGGGARRADGKLAGRKLPTTHTRSAEARDRSAAALGDLTDASQTLPPSVVGGREADFNGLAHIRIAYPHDRTGSAVQMRARYAHRSSYSTVQMIFRTAVGHRRDTALQRHSDPKSTPQHASGARIGRPSRLAKTDTLLRHSGRHHAAWAASEQPEATRSCHRGGRSRRSSSQLRPRRRPRWRRRW